MNQLIIVGNGFDKAHGLPTLYTDFLFDYFKRVLTEELISNTVFENENLSARFNFSSYFNSHAQQPVMNKLRERIAESEKYVEIKKIIKDINVKVNWENSLLETIFKGKTNNWSDIEYVFYKEICTLINQQYSSQDLEWFMKSLNNEFERIKKELYSYLKEKINPIIKTKPLIPKLSSKIKLKKSLDYSWIFLNFNYTNTIENYLKRDFDGYKHEVINIHGSITEGLESVIFGYGDDNHKYAKQFKELNSIEIQKNFKSHNYLLSDHYSNLFKRLNQGFEVLILGHSCGVSDRVLLSNIVNHENFAGLRILHYKNEENYLNTCYNLSYCFNDPHIYRTMIKPFDKADEFPQMTISS